MLPQLVPVVCLAPSWDTTGGGGDALCTVAHTQQLYTASPFWDQEGAFCSETVTLCLEDTGALNLKETEMRPKTVIVCSLANTYLFLDAAWTRTFH